MLFTFPSRYSSTIGHQGVFSLGRWSSQIPTGFHVSRGTRVPSRSRSPFAYGAFTLSGRAFQLLLPDDRLITPWWVCNPTPMVPRPPRCNGCSLTQRGFRLVPFRSPLLGESRLISFPPGTEMFQFPGLASSRLCIQRGMAGFTGSGFPIRRSSGQCLCSGSPMLFAATYVLLRLLVPRHPPYALSSLAFSSQQRLLHSRAATPEGSRPASAALICFVSLLSTCQRTRGR